MIAVVPAPPAPAPAAADPSAVALIEALVSGPLTASTLAGTLLPLLTGLVTGRTWHPAVKGGMLAALSFAAAVTAELVATERSGDPVEWRTILTAAVVTWVVGQVAHQGLWRHTALSRGLQAVSLTRPAPTPAPTAPWGSPGDVDVAERSVAAIRARVRAESPAVRPIKAPVGPRRQHTPAPPLPTAAVDPGQMRRARPPRYLRDDDGPTTLPER